MIYFISDYSRGAHPKVLEALQRTNMENHNGYGKDEHCFHAANLIREMIGQPKAEVHFLTGGTPANVTTIASALEPYESVVCARSGHIYQHETGAIEATGHKVVPYDKDEGKLTPADLDRAWSEYEDENTSIPRLAYISQPTELGTIYSKAELKALRDCCDTHGMMLYLDGSRLASALTADTADATLQDIAAFTDAFYIGGTKNGLLLGEAVVINNPRIADHYRWMMRQKNALLAKGRVLGVQFEALLEGGDESIFYEMGKHENLMAQRLASGIRDAGFQFRWEPVTNQIFPILPDMLVAQLHKDFMFHDWEKLDGKDKKDSQTVVRFVIDWGTTPEEVDALVEAIHRG